MYAWRDACISRSFEYRFGDLKLLELVTISRLSRYATIRQCWPICYNPPRSESMTCRWQERGPMRRSRCWKDGTAHGTGGSCWRWDYMNHRSTNRSTEGRRRRCPATIWSWVRLPY